MKVLITGAGGYLGRGLYLPFVGRHELRLMDIVPFERPPHEVFVGDVARLDDARRAVRGCDALVIAHMASRQAGAYETPEGPFDANVKGTANLFFAAVEAGIKRVVLVSSTGVVHGYTPPPGTFFDRHSPVGGKGLYCLTKVCQEVIAEQYQREHSLAVGVLRIGCVMDGDTMIDKYGKRSRERGLSFTDRRDIGEVARLCLEDPTLGYEILYVLGTPESFDMYDVAYTCRRLDWRP
jgi:nucleoside-diphosphate-sugar epimerase